MNIHAIQTGTVALTSKWRDGTGGGRRRLLNTLLDREWTEPLPIYAFVIEHPEGVIVVDTGETARISEPGYFPRWQPFFRFAVRESVLPEILVSRTELDYASGLQGRFRGYPNKRWPSWFAPEQIDLAPDPLGPFPHSLPLTEAGDVTLVPVPGHSPGQLAVLVEDGDHTVFLAGDSSYTQDAMLRGAVDGVGSDERAQRLTHERIRAYAEATPTVYLPTHDPETATRLAERRTVELRAVA